MRLVAHRDDDYLFAHWDGSSKPADAVGDVRPAMSTPILCGTTDGYVHPAYDYTQSSGGLGEGGGHRSLLAEDD